MLVAATPAWSSAMALGLDKARPPNSAAGMVCLHGGHVHRWRLTSAPRLPWRYASVLGNRAHHQCSCTNVSTDERCTQTFIGKSNLHVLY